MADNKYRLTLAGENTLSSVFKQVERDSEQLTSGLKEQEKQLTQLSAAGKKLENWKMGRRELEQTGKQLERAKLKTQALGREMAVSGKPTKAMSVAFAKAKKQSDALQRAYDRQKVGLHQLKKELRDSGIDTGKLGGEQGRLRRDIERTTQEINRQREAFKRKEHVEAAISAAETKRQERAKAHLSAGQTRLDNANARFDQAQSEVLGATAMVATLAAPVARAVSMEAAMVDVTKVFDFEEGGADAFASQLQKLAVETNIDATELTAIAAAAGQSGVAKTEEELLAFTESAAKMGVAFEIGADEAGETMAAWRSAMALNQESVMELADVTNHVANSMNAKAPMLAEVLKRQGAVGVASGLKATETAGLAGAILSSGASAEVASTTMKNLLVTMVSGDAASSTQKEALDSLGLDAVTLAADMQEDATGTIKELFEALSETPVEEQTALVTQLFGRESMGGIMPLLKNLKLLDKGFYLAADKVRAQGSMMEEFARVADTTDFRFGALIRSFDRLMIITGGSLLPGLGYVAEGLTSGVNALSDFAEANKEVTDIVTGSIATLAAWKVASIGRRMIAAKLDAMRAKSQIRQAKLATTQGMTAKTASAASVALERFNRVMRRTAFSGGDDGGYYGGDEPDKKDKKKRKQSRFKRGGKITNLAGKIARPLGIMLSGGALFAAAKNGDTKEATTLAGDVGGGMAGAATGAVLGSMILPGIGTLVGSIVGGMIGSETGQLLGEELGDLFTGDKLEPPESITPEPMVAKIETTLSLEKVPANIDEEKVAQMVVDKQKAELLPLMGSGPQNRIDDSMEIVG